MPNTSDAQALSRELAQLKLEFSRRYAELSLKIEKLQSADTTAISTKTPLNETSMAKRPQSVTYAASPAPSDRQAHISRQPAAQTATKQPNYVTKLLLLFIHWLTPVASLITPITKQYKHFQAKGMGPLFLFVVLGLLMLVAGFGYLAQLVVSGMHPLGQTLLLFAFAATLTTTGIILARQARHKHTGSVVMALGILINFVTLYVAGSYYTLFNTTTTIFAYFVLAMLSLALAYRFSAPLIAALSLLGASLLPLIWGLGTENLFLYLVGLGLISASNLYLAFRQKWQKLGVFMVTLVIASTASLSTGNDRCLFWFAEILYLAFSLYALLVYATTAQQAAKWLLLLVAVTASTTALLYANEHGALPWVALFNTGLAVLFWRKAFPSKLAAMPFASSVLLMLSSYWLIVAAFAFLNPHYWSIAVGLEGVMLLFIAKREQLTWVRVEAQGLIATAILLALLLLASHFPLPALANIKGISITLSIGMLICLWRVLSQDIDDKLALEKKLHGYLLPLESLWIFITLLALAWVYLHHWWGLVALLSQGIMFYRARHYQSRTAEQLVFAALLPLVGSLLFAAVEANSLHFAKLALYGKCAALLLMVDIWLLAQIYPRLYPHGSLLNAAKQLGLALYFFLPLLYLPHVARYQADFLALALWSSAICSYSLARLIRAPLLRSESLLLTVIASVFALLSYSVQQGNEIHNGAALMAGALFSGYFFIRQYGHHQAQLEQKIAAMAVFYLVLALALPVAKTLDLYAAGLVMWFCWLLCMLNPIKHPTLKQQRSAMICAQLLLLLLAITLIHWQQSLSAHLLIAAQLLMLIYSLRKHSIFAQTLQGLCWSASAATWLHNSLVLLCYCALLVAWELTLIIAPSMILHAIFLLFSANARQTNALPTTKALNQMGLVLILLALAKLALMDMANALLWQKILLMLGMGAAMLLAALWYQKRQKQRLTA